MYIFLYLTNFLFCSMGIKYSHILFFKQTPRISTGTKEVPHFLFNAQLQSTMGVPFHLERISKGLTAAIRRCWNSKKKSHYFSQRKDLWKVYWVWGGFCLVLLLLLFSLGQKEEALPPLLGNKCWFPLSAIFYHLLCMLSLSRPKCSWETLKLRYN